MTAILRAQVGQVVPLRWTLREVRSDSLDGRIHRANGGTVDIKSPADASVIANGGILMDDDGTFIYHWDTAGLAVGEYRVKARFGTAFSSGSPGVQRTFEHDTVVRLVKAL